VVYNTLRTTSKNTKQVLLDNNVCIITNTQVEQVVFLIYGSHTYGLTQRFGEPESVEVSPAELRIIESIYIILSMETLTKVALGSKSESIGFTRKATGICELPH